MAGRKSVSVKTISKHLTKDEKLIREAVEDKIKGKCDKLIPPDYLNDGQMEIFYFIVDELSESNILGNLDKFAIEKTGDYYTNGALEIKFIESNLSPVDVDKLYKYFAYSHPTTKERIELSNSYAH